MRDQSRESVVFIKLSWSQIPAETAAGIRTGMPLIKITFCIDDLVENHLGESGAWASGTIARAAIMCVSLCK